MHRDVKPSNILIDRAGHVKVNYLTPLHFEILILSGLCLPLKNVNPSNEEFLNVAIVIRIHLIKRGVQTA